MNQPEQNRDDLRVLDEVLGFSLTEGQRKAFSTMRDRLLGESGSALSKKQRKWVNDIHEMHVPKYVAKGAASGIPRGKEITINVGPLVKRPPHRRNETSL